MRRVNYEMTIGLNDKDTEKQIIKTEDAKKIVADLLINKYGLYAFTIWECDGVYKMESTNNIVSEKSLKIQIVSDDYIDSILMIVNGLKKALNQESIMLSENTANITFV